MFAHSLSYASCSDLLIENQIFGDPDAADIVFTSGADVLAVGINVTHQVVLTGTLLAFFSFYVNIYIFFKLDHFIN